MWSRSVREWSVILAGRVIVGMKMWVRELSLLSLTIGEFTSMRFILMSPQIILILFSLGKLSGFSSSFSMKFLL